MPENEIKRFGFKLKTRAKNHTSSIDCETLSMIERILLRNFIFHTMKPIIARTVSRILFVRLCRQMINDMQHIIYIKKLWCISWDLFV